MTSIFDTIVIGKGLVGSACAKYLSASESKIAIIGPDEPIDYSKSIVYASHYDEARVQRIVGKDEVWTKLNHDSVKQYVTIERDSGINFHFGAGCLYVNPYGVDDYINAYKESADSIGLHYESFTNTANYTTVKGFTFPDSSAAIFECGPSGYINPRKLIRAQLNIFAKYGGHHLTNTVINVNRIGSGDFLLQTESRDTCRAKKVVVATGSFANYLDILQQKVDLINKSEVVLLIQLDEDNLVEYATLPSLLYEIDEEKTEGIYLIPPVRYPDGNYYLKVGCNSPMDMYFDSLAQIKEWFVNAATEKFKAPLVNAVKKLLPSLSLENSHLKKCIISRTRTGRPYVGETLVPGLFLAGGCNGYSAMCSDAIGHVTSRLVLEGIIPDPYPKEAFAIVYKQ